MAGHSREIAFRWKWAYDNQVALKPKLGLG